MVHPNTPRFVNAEKKAMVIAIVSQAKAMSSWLMYNPYFNTG
jgi:hypothetical protein